MNPREILNRYRWSRDLSINDLEIYYIHRGAPDDLRMVDGSDITEIGRSFFSVGPDETKIPYHRIVKIKIKIKIKIKGKNTIFDRRSGERGE